MTDPTTDWPLMPDPRISDDAYYRRLSAAYSHRLRTTAEALREVMTWAAPMSEAPRSSRPAWFDSARAILARLDQEGPA